MPLLHPDCYNISSTLWCRYPSREVVHNITFIFYHIPVMLFHDIVLSLPLYQQASTELSSSRQIIDLNIITTMSISMIIFPLPSTPKHSTPPMVLLYNNNNNYYYNPSWLSLSTTQYTTTTITIIRLPTIHWHWYNLLNTFSKNWSWHVLSCCLSMPWSWLGHHKYITCLGCATYVFRCVPFCWLWAMGK